MLKSYQLLSYGETIISVAFNLCATLSYLIFEGVFFVLPFNLYYFLSNLFRKRIKPGVLVCSYQTQIPLMLKKNPWVPDWPHINTHLLYGVCITDI